MLSIVGMMTINNVRLGNAIIRNSIDWAIDDRMRNFGREDTLGSIARLMIMLHASNNYGFFVKKLNSCPNCREDHH